MKKIFKRIISSVLSVLLLIINLPISEANNTMQNFVGMWFQQESDDPIILTLNQDNSLGYYASVSKDSIYNSTYVLNDNILILNLLALDSLKTISVPYLVEQIDNNTIKITVNYNNIDYSLESLYGMEQIIAGVYKCVAFTDEQLNNIKKDLGVPDNLDVDVKVSETASYWDAAQMWIVNVDILYNGQKVAGAFVNSDTAELARNIWVFSYDHIENFKPIPDYKYDEVDVGKNLTIPTVNDITNKNQAINKVQNAVNKATEEQKQSATGIDKLTLLAEEAAAKANTVKLTNNNISITAENIKTSTALQATTNVLTSANVNLERTARNIINYDLGDTETINVKTEDVSNKVDAIRVSTSYASATVNANTTSDFTMTNKGEKTVEINFNKDTDTTVTISFPNVNENDKYYAVVDENGNPVGGKYNPATGTLEAKLTESGIYKVVNNEKDFADIKDKSAEMQEAIKVLASKGIINGTTATTFAPDSTISRAEVTALLMRTISLLDPNANGNFADVSTSNWYCGAAGSAKEHNIINGYEDNTFRGNTVIAKDQIVAVSARTLKQQMNYKTPSDIAGELSVYADANSIASWAKEDVALATMTNLVLKRTDNTFSGTDGMTRGDTAIIMQRLFNKLW